MPKTNYKIIEVCDNGARIMHNLSGRKEDIKNYVGAYKEISKDYKIVGNNTVIVWT